MTDTNTYDYAAIERYITENPEYELKSAAKRMGIPAIVTWRVYQLMERRKDPGFNPESKTSRVLAALRESHRASNTRIAAIVGCSDAHVTNIRRLWQDLLADPITAPHYAPAKPVNRKIGSAPMYGVLESELASNPNYRAQQPEPEPDIVTQVLAERGKDYGDYAGKAQFIQGVKYLMRSSPSWQAMDADMRESMEMIAHKMGRTLYGNPAHKDNFLDIAGYAKLVADRL
jgi:hypothetical protein